MEFNQYLWVFVLLFFLNIRGIVMLKILESPKSRIGFKNTDIENLTLLSPRLQWMKLVMLKLKKR